MNDLETELGFLSECVNRITHPHLDPLSCSKLFWQNRIASRQKEIAKHWVGYWALYAHPNAKAPN